jgi:hypothetical protein
LISGDGKLSIFDPSLKSIISSVELSNEAIKIKSVVWSGGNNRFVALITKKYLTILTKQLTRVC